MNMADTFKSTHIVNIWQLYCVQCHKENPVFGHQMRRQAHPKQKQPAVVNTIQNKNMYALVCYAYIKTKKIRIHNLADRKAFEWNMQIIRNMHRIKSRNLLKHNISIRFGFSNTNHTCFELLDHCGNGRSLFYFFSFVVVVVIVVVWF